MLVESARRCIKYDIGLLIDPEKTRQNLSRAHAPIFNLDGAAVQTESIERWIHDHTFGQDNPKMGERRTLIVIAITALAMVGEIVAGYLFGSMALLADGLHMGTHALALSISAFAYYYTRHHAKDPRFNFGTGKVNSLAAFASAMLLVIFALAMVWESTKRFISPVRIEFDLAILVAVLGLVVNGVCLVILKEPGRGHGHDGGAHKDHNLWAAYLHVMADALTSLLAIFALLAGKYLGQGWLDPFMGVVGAALVTCWSIGLIRSSSHVLLDMQAPEALRQAIRESIEGTGDERITDLHVWAVGPGIFAVEITVVSSAPRPSGYYRELLPRNLGLVHGTVEVHRCPSQTSAM